MGHCVLRKLPCHMNHCAHRHGTTVGVLVKVNQVVRVGDQLVGTCNPLARTAWKVGVAQVVNLAVNP